MLLALLGLTKGTFLFFGVFLLMYGLYAMGFATGRFPEHEWGARDSLSKLPIWVALGFFALIVGVAFVIGGLSDNGGCDYGPCEPAGRP